MLRVVAHARDHVDTSTRACHAFRCADARRKCPIARFNIGNLQVGPTRLQVCPCHETGSQFHPAPEGKRGLVAEPLAGFVDLDVDTRRVES